MLAALAQDKEFNPDLFCMVLEQPHLFSVEDFESLCLIAEIDGCCLEIIKIALEKCIADLL